MKRLNFVLLLAILVLPEVHGQDENRKPEIDEKYKMFSKTMWRRMDFNIKQNSPFNSVNGEMNRLLFEALKNKDIKAYKSDSCVTVATDDELTEMLSIIEVVGVDHDNDPFTPDVLDSVTTELPSNLFEIMYIKEDVIFDRNRSRMYWYIRSLALTVPSKPENLANYNIAGELDKVVYFKYDEVVDAFRGNDKYSDRAIWYNDSNMGSHRNVIDAMELRLFSAPIIKVSNNQDRDIRQIYADEIAENPMMKLILQQQLEFDLAEYEAELWSY